MEDKRSFWSVFYEQLASLKFTIFILFALAATSLVGTLLPQGGSQEEIVARYGAAMAKIIDMLGLADLYHAGWFRLLLLLLGVNLIVCTMERLPKTLKLLRYRDRTVEPEKLLKLASHAEMKTSFTWDQVRPVLERIVSETIGPVRRVEMPSGDGAYAAVAEKGRWSLLMVYVVHLSVLVVLLGALTGSVFGFKAFMNIAEGESTDEAEPPSGNGVFQLPFQVRLDKFDVSFYEGGMPKDYRSDVTIIDGGREALKGSVRVNDPLTYNGVTFYQASYGSVLKQAEIEIQNTQSGAVYKLTLPFKEMVDIPETQSKIMAMHYEEDFSGFGPAIVLVVFDEGAKPAVSRVLVNHPDFHGNQFQNYRVRVLRTEQSRYTGLQVKRDPGVWIVWCGFITMILGIAAAYWMGSRKVWVWASTGAGKGGVRIVVAGRADKDTFAFEQIFEDLCEQLRTELKAEDANAAADGAPKAGSRKNGQEIR